MKATPKKPALETSATPRLKSTQRLSRPSTATIKTARDHIVSPRRPAAEKFNQKSTRPKSAKRNQD